MKFEWTGLIMHILFCDRTLKGSGRAKKSMLSPLQDTHTNTVTHVHIFTIIAQSTIRGNTLTSP